jgi:peptide-methionine (S)-S-oxide reductase
LDSHDIADKGVSLTPRRRGVQLQSIHLAHLWDDSYSEANANALECRPKYQQENHMTQSTPASAPGEREIAVLGGGCFWCLEAIYDNVRGVTDVVSGYAGGHVAEPNYKQVCTGTTGHAEVVRVTFDPRVITYRDVLDIFFAIHDPTTLNRQGADVGPQYRSAIFYSDLAQQQAAEQVIRELTERKLFSRPIVTEVTPLQVFYPAEDYHQEYFANNPSQGYCQFVIAPKVAKFRKEHLERWKK